MSIMNTAVSGMKAQSNRLATVGDNIANASTVGYKKTSTQFSALVMDAGSGSYNAGGVETHVRRAVSLEGGLTSTTSTTDLAIRGSGFFIVDDGSGARYMTRAGSFVEDAEGYLVNAAGYYLTGYDIRNGDSGVIVNSLNGGERINVNNLNIQATPTTGITFPANLDARDDVAVVAAGTLPSDNVAGSTYTSKSSIIVYDNLGGEVKLDVYFAKTATNGWQMSVFDARTADAATGGFPYAAGGLLNAGGTAITFDPANGSIQTPPVADRTVNLNVPGGATVAFDFSKLTQVKMEYTPLEPTVNGNAPSTVSGINIGDDGVVSFAMKNGTTVDGYRLPLADVPSPDNLTALSGGLFQVSNESGSPLVGFPGQGSLGSIRTNALESSNVDLADELSTMIEAQRNYTANSKAFQTGAEVLEVLVNLKR
ncbi:flagellar hook protein FlgE [Pseudochelatococcus contaminans]|uniref:Flagellar hook protein FlgE n=1 Tax=Pseudochelatococcus contaminans TaxID=1538103 RepID=A0A7W5Z0Z1_9HYPH|nr:flagellar hook protein FlgE [Pseudochelatococcus contaminans]MBB3808013.1 flagellar hook protein FlgE [Pseudochelatococcus contaminans]